jgi:hypothetical protein
MKDWGLLVIILLLVWISSRSQQPQRVSNEETWEWIDYRGQRRQITVHRNVRQQSGNEQA